MGIMRRKRRGFTLLEVVTVITISAAVFLGFVVLLYDVAEQMHISWQLREAEEYGQWYVKQFVEKMRNGYNQEITHVTAPSEAQVVYTPPKQYAFPEHLRTVKTYEFEYNHVTGLPAIRANDVIVEYPYWPPQVMDSRDFFTIDPASFRIYPSRDEYLPQRYDSFRKEFLTLEFEITYQRQSSIPGRGVYEKVMPFRTSAYVYNGNWPVIEPPAGFEDE